MTENPFDDPAVTAFMEQHGIVHKPGLAQEMLTELAPLLAAEGIDLDDPEGVGSIEELNAALGRAVEQRNLQIMTPISTERDLTHEFLLEVTELLAAGKLRDAERAVESIEPEPTANRPPASHIIGEGFGRLDTWYTDAKLGPALENVTIPKWRGPAGSTARRLLTYARRGEAYDSMDSFLIQHGGLFVMHSVILAVAGTIISHAAAQGVSIPQSAAELFEHSGAPAAPGSSFGVTTPTRSAARDAYREWLQTDSDGDSQLFEQFMMLFEALEHISSVEHLDIDNPDAVSYLIDAILDSPEEAVDALLESLESYIHFRLDAEPDDSAEEWEALLWELIDVKRELHPEHTLLLETLTAAQEFPEADKQRAFQETLAIAGIRNLIEWVGESHPVTQTGNLRRVDLAPAARFFGFYVEGVAKLPPPTSLDLEDSPGERPDDPLHVQSMSSVPVLSSAWEALRTMEVLTFTSTTVRPGPRLDFALNTDADSLERLATVFIMEALLQPLNRNGSFYATLVDFTLARLLDALDPQRPPLVDSYSPLAGNFLERELAQAGFITLKESQEIDIPDAFKGAVAGAVLMTIGILQKSGGLQGD